MCLDYIDSFSTQEKEGRCHPQKPGSQPINHFMKNIESLSKTTVGPNYSKLKKAAAVFGGILLVGAAVCFWFLSKGDSNFLPSTWNGNDPSSISESVESILIGESSIMVDVGHMKTLDVSVVPSKYQDKLVWTSSDETVATVRDGIVTAVAPGITSVTAQSPYGYCTAKCQVIVAKDDAGTPYRISDKSLSLAPGEAAGLSIKEANSKSTVPVVWKSSNEKVATVKGNGQVTAVDFGYCMVSAYNRESGDLIASCAVSVRASVQSVTLDVSAITLSVGGDTKFTATVEPNTATNRNVTWESSNTAVATVYKGTVKAIGTGTATITVKTVDGEKTATCTVTVQPRVERVVLQKDSLTIKLNETASLAATIWPETLTNKEVIWYSNNSNIVSVDERGKLIGLNYGSATITCAAKADSDVRATCVVTVVREAEGVTLDPTSVTVARGGSVQVKAKVYPAGSTDKSVIWTTDNASVATVDEKGVVKGVSAGMTKITCKTVSGGYKAECQVVVVDPITEISFTRGSITLSEGETYAEAIDVNVVPSSSKDNIKVYSSDSSIATVTVAGGTLSIKGIKGGETTIIAEATDGTGKKASLTVSVSSTGAAAFSTEPFEGGLAVSGLTGEWKSLFVGSTLTIPAYINGKAIRSISSNAFDSALTGISVVNIPETVIHIGSNAFSRNSELSTVNMPTSLMKIDTGAFQQTGVDTVVVPKGVTEIGEDAFKNCTNLTKVSLPTGLQRIGGGAFYGNYKLTSISIPENVVEVGDGAFYDSGLETVVFNTTKISTITANLFGMTAFKSVNIPSGVTKIQAGAFRGNVHLSEVTIPDTVVSIAEYAFADCSALKKVKVSESITSIGTDAFNGLPDDVKFIVASESVKELLISNGIPAERISAK